jgi:hypothetical protein
MSIQKNSDKVTDVGFRPVIDIRAEVPEKLGSDVINVEKSFFIIQITGRMSDGHPSFSGTSGQMSDTGLNPISATSSEFFWMLMYALNSTAEEALNNKKF